MKKLYVLIAAIILSFQGYSASISSTLSNQIICSSNYTTISDIVITEGGTGEFGTASANTSGNLFFIVAPSGFEFDPSAGVNPYFAGGGNGSGASVLFKTASVIAITYSCNNTIPLASDVLTINSIGIKALSLNTSGSIYLGTGSFAIGGGPNGGSPGTTLANVICAVNSISFTPTDQCVNGGSYTLLGTSSRQAGVNNNVKTYSGPGVTGGGTTFDPIAAGGAGSYTLTYSFSTNSPSCAAFSTTATIVVTKPPVVTMTSSESSGLANNDNITCGSDSITFYANGASTYQFLRNGTNGIGASTVTPYSRVNLATGDLMTVKGTDANGCVAVSNTITMTVNAPPAAVAFNPTVTTFSSSSHFFVLDTLSPAPSAANPWNINSYFTGDGVVPGTGTNAGKDLFYPDVAANFGNPVAITYTYVDVNGCKKSTNQNFNISGAVSIVGINGLNIAYCSNGATSSISMDSIKTLTLAACPYYYNISWPHTFVNFEYQNPVNSVWYPIASIPSSGKYSATFDPSILAANGGTGLRLVRAVYTPTTVPSFLSVLCPYPAAPQYVDQYVTINSLPSISIPNYLNDNYNTGDYPCDSWGDSTLTFGYSSPNVSISGFTSGTPGFLYFSGAYKLKWSVGALYPAHNNFSFTVHDATTTCTNTVLFSKSVYSTPTIPTFAAVADNCVGDAVVLKDTVNSSLYASWVYSEWYKKNGGANTLLTSTYHYLGFNAKTVDLYNVGTVSATDTFVVREYYYASCKSPFSSPIVVKVNTPPTVDAGTYPTVCTSNPVVTLAGTRTPGGLGITWTSKTAGSFSASPNIHTPNPVYTGSAADSVAKKIVLYLTTNDPDGIGVGCNAVVDSAVINVNIAPLVNAGLPAFWCSNTNPIITATYPGTVSSVAWTKSAGSGTIVSPTLSSTSYLVAPGDYATGLPFPITFTAKTNDPDGPGPCTFATSSVLVTLNPHLTVNAGSDITVCANQTINLSGNVKIGGVNRNAANVNLWKNVNGLGTISQSTPNFSAIYNGQGVATTSGHVVPGTGELATTTTVKVDLVSSDPDGTGPNGPCLADSQRINITINPIPIPYFDPATVYEYCINDKVKLLNGNLGGTSALTGPSASFTGLTGGGAYVYPSGSQFDFDPKKTSLLNNGGGVYGIRYNYKDNLGCQNYADTVFTVFPNPVVNFTTSSRCQFDTVTFAKNSSVSTAVFPLTVEKSWAWVIDGATTQDVSPFAPLNTPSVKYAFANYGIHSIELAITTNSLGVGHLSCSTTKDTTLIFGPYPNTDYSWSRPCSVDSVFFVNNTTIPSGYTNSTYWNMNDLGAGSYKSATSKNSLNPNYKFAKPNIYKVQLIDTTTLYKCVKITTKEVYIVPTYSITPSSPYDSSFSTNRNWAPSGHNDQPYSWQHGVPTAAKHVIKPRGGVPAWSGNNVWITNLNGDYKVGELSYLNSPCFNFSTLDKPMLVMKEWTSSTNLAGTVLEATTGNTNVWNTLGQIGSGMNWYNTTGVVGLIGASSSNPTAQGFSGQDTTFRLSRVGLPQFANQSNLVRFRLVFGSSNVVDALNKRDGFALDSIWIGNRSKVVLMEHFTNSLSNPCIAANDSVNSIQAQRPGDVISLHYHTNFPGIDLMNKKSDVDVSSKELYYGLTSVPETHIDGIQTYNTYGNNIGAINKNVIDNKALEDAKFGLDVSCNKTGFNMNIKALMVAKVPVVGQSVVMNIAVLERQISYANGAGNSTNGYQWVMRKMLPNAAGTYISRNWKAKDSLSVPASWTFQQGDFYDTSKIEVVAFVQNYDTKEVYQAAIIGSNGNTSALPIITAITSVEAVGDLMIYPVPSDDQINVLFSDDTKEEADYSLMNDLGVTVASGKILKGVRMLTFNSKQYAAGVYYLSIIREDGGRINRKIMVIH